jgi:hypothetical protein
MEVATRRQREGARLGEYDRLFEREGERMWRTLCAPFPPDISSYLSIVQGTPLDVRGQETPDRTWVFLANSRTFNAIDGTAGVLSEVADSLFVVEPGKYILFGVTVVPAA